MLRTSTLLILACLVAVCKGPVQAQSPVHGQKKVSVIDYTGNTVTLNKPARRIIALAPHAVENTFSANAGDRLVAVVAYSDYPEAAKKIQQIGSNNLLNLEAIIALQPDLIIAWQSGNTRQSIKRLRDLGFTLYIDEPKSLEDIAKSIRDIGVLAGTRQAAAEAADSYLSQLGQLLAEHRSLPPVTVFYQVWNQPLQTINGRHLISAAIELCGGRNIYAEQASIAPVINIESIIARDPQVIIASGISDSRPAWLDEWQQWPQLSAVRNNHLYFVPANHLQRHTVRILKGIQAICGQLARVRLNSDQRHSPQPLTVPPRK